jgi:hypothetical protein
LGGYVPFGSKDDEYLEYQKLAFIQKNIEGLNEEAIDEFSIALGKLHKWLKLALDTRINDVLMRIKEKNNERTVRDNAISQEEERIERRNDALEAARENWENGEDEEEGENDKEAEKAEGDGEKKEGDAEKQAKPDSPKEFDEEAFNKKFDEDDPPIDIPPEVVDYVDNDFNLEYPEDEAAE